uniref:Uncharacterized protein n=1 Tax=Glossina austeni TaxID=7395 RepID=A0A1A9VBI5_GLOAU
MSKSNADFSAFDFNDSSDNSDVETRAPFLSRAALNSHNNNSSSNHHNGNNNGRGNSGRTSQRNDSVRTLTTPASSSTAAPLTATHTNGLSMDSSAPGNSVDSNHVSGGGGNCGGVDGSSDGGGGLASNLTEARYNHDIKKMIKNKRKLIHYYV